VDRKPKHSDLDEGERYANDDYIPF